MTKTVIPAQDSELGIEPVQTDSPPATERSKFPSVRKVNLLDCVLCPFAHLGSGGFCGMCWTVSSCAGVRGPGQLPAASYHVKPWSSETFRSTLYKSLVSM